MGLISRLFAGAGDAENHPGAATLTCSSCGCAVDEHHMEEGQCEDCYASDYLGPKYCCGQIYEEGEETCRGCGDPL